MEVERRERWWGVSFNFGGVGGSVGKDTQPENDRLTGAVSWANTVMSPAEARAFAHRIIAVADAVEAELSKEVNRG